VTKGQIVTALMYGGEQASRRVIADKGNTIVICSEEEYQRAEREGREPQGIGFPRQDVLESPSQRKVARSEAQGSKRLADAGD
jgi:hypothetical protein